jgi:hypothetical protein
VDGGSALIGQKLHPRPGAVGLTRGLPAALAGDVARAGEDARHADTEQVRRKIELLGALLAAGDPGLSDEILERTARAVHRLAPERD